MTDGLRIIASPLATVPTHTLDGWLADFFSRENVNVIVVGRPTQMDGGPSETMKYIEPFVEKLRKTWPDKRVVWHDERFTSVMAHRAMIEGGMKKMARRDRAVVDRVSASIILQSYMMTL